MLAELVVVLCMLVETGLCYIADRHGMLYRIVRLCGHDTKHVPYHLSCLSGFPDPPPGRAARKSWADETVLS